MKFLSLCSGLDAASLAWGPLGWQAVAFSEIDPAPCHVLHNRYGAGRPWFMPDSREFGLSIEDRVARAIAIKNVHGLPHVEYGSGSPPNFGDMSRFEEWPDVSIDLLCGGTPCQSFSVAGLRGGLADLRGNLMLTFGRVAARYRPVRLVWENVPGVLSSDGGRDFASFLGLLTGRSIPVPINGWRSSGIIPGIDSAYGVAYRVLDAQYFGVAQRRRRVFVVGYLGDWRRAAAVLFERHSLRGDPAPRRQTRQEAAACAGAGVDGGGTGLALDGGSARGSGDGGGRGGSLVPEVAGTLGGSSQSGGFRTTDLDNSGAFIPMPGTFWDGGQVTSTLDASVGTKRQTMPEKDRLMAALVPVAFTGDGETADPIIASEGKTYTHEGSTFRLHNCVGVDLRNGKVTGDDATHALQAGGMGEDRGLCPNAIPHCIAFSAKDHGADAAEELSPTLRAGQFDGSHANGGVMPAVAIPILEAGKRTGRTGHEGRDGLGVGDDGDPMFTLQASAQHGVAAMAFKASHFTRGKDGAPSDLYPPLSADADKGDQDPLVLAFDTTQVTSAANRSNPKPGDPCHPLAAGAHAPALALPSMLVRRLMPIECERLQAVPDDFTLVLYRGKLMADGPRYKMLGNSWCVYNVRWIGQRMEMLERLCP
jgi:DNA (cytosine-5)-methyltransferase 1